MFDQNEETRSEEILKIRDEILNNLKYLNERNDKLSALLKRSEDIIPPSIYRQGKKVRRTIYLKKVRLFGIIGIILLLFFFIYFSVSLACHSMTFQC